MSELDIYKQKLKEYLKNQIEVYDRWEEEAREKIVDEVTYNYINTKIIADRVGEYKYYERSLMCYREILDILEEFDKVAE